MDCCRLQGMVSLMIIRAGLFGGLLFLGNFSTGWSGPLAILEEKTEVAFMSTLLSQVGVILVILIIALVILRICLPGQAKLFSRYAGVGESGARRPAAAQQLQSTETRILPQFIAEWNDGRRRHTAPLYGKEDGFFIGRQDADLVLASDYVSSPHARIEEDQEGRLWLEDLDSLNGTKQHGKRIHRTQITDGLVLMLGDVELTFRLAGAGRTSAGHGGIREAGSMTRQFQR